MIGVIGSGTMGKGIAIEFARFGYKVILLSAERHLPANAIADEVDKISTKYNDINVDKIHSNITNTNDPHLLAKCNYIIEAVSEDLSKKRSILKEVQSYVLEDTLFGTNTSSLSVKEIFSGIVNLSLVCGVHFFNPVHNMKLVELSYLEESDSETIDKFMQLANSLGKEVVLVKNSPGFIVNRLLIPMINEASRIVEEGTASVEDVDKAMKLGLNHPIGPLRLSDLIGNDITLAILYSLKDKLNISISDLLRMRVANNELGRKTKKGFYDYIK